MQKHAILLAALLPLCQGARAAIPSCPPISPSVQLDIPEPTIDRSMDAAALARAAGSRSEPHALREIVWGFYKAGLRVASEGSMSLMATAPAGPFAVCLDGLAVKILARPSISIARELAIGGCADQAVSAHEYNHHRIELAKIAEALPVYLAHNPLPSIPFVASTPQQASALANAYGKAYVHTLVESLENFIEPAQFAFDSHEEYRRVNSLCSTEFRPLVAKQMRAW